MASRSISRSGSLPAKRLGASSYRYTSNSSSDFCPCLATPRFHELVTWYTWRSVGSCCPSQRRADVPPLEEEIDLSMAGYWASSSSNSALVTTSASTGIMLENRSLQLEGKQCGRKTEKVRTKEPTATPASMSADAMRNESVCTDIRTPYTAAAAVADRVWASNQQCVCRAVRASQGPGTEVVRCYVLRRVQFMRLTGWCWRAWGIRKYKRAQCALLLRLSPVRLLPPVRTERWPRSGLQRLSSVVISTPAGIQDICTYNVRIQGCESQGIKDCREMGGQPRQEPAPSPAAGSEAPAPQHLARVVPANKR